MVFEGVELSLPPRFFFNTPPAEDPLTLLPPSHEQSIRSPAALDPTTYHWTFSAQVPFTFSITYFSIVTILNAVNRRRGNKPTAIAQTSAFKAFVLWHNLALAVYSGVTCAALVRAMYVSVPAWWGPHGLSATLDALCKIHGPGGFGNAVTYNPASLTWTAKNSSILLGAGGIIPNQADLGRIWNEGLAFWGWLFYLSKYYEVVDTIIILLKGKRATTLQKYHHAGALLCMWAGMRYMSPPIWMFVLVNSGIHALMYTFYTVSTLGIRVPAGVKQTLTTMQIMQFLVGSVFAAAHLFISYRIPVTTPYKVMSVVTAAAKAAPSAASGILAASKISAQTPLVAPWLKKLLYRATGAEGLAETVGDTRLQEKDQQQPLMLQPKPHTKTRTHYETVHCLDTNGEAFAIWLNVFYLAPLTLLFLRFFWKSYIIGKPKKKTQVPLSPRRLSVSAMDAARETSKSFEDYGTEFEKSFEWGTEELTDRVENLRTNETIEQLEQELKQVYDEIVKSDETSGGEIIEEIAEPLETPTQDTAVVESISQEQEVNEVSRQSSKSSSKSKGKAKKAGGMSEQHWFGRSSTPSSLRKETDNNVDSEEQMSTSTSSAQLLSWTDIKEEHINSSSVSEHTLNGPTYADVTKHGEPSDHGFGIHDDDDPKAEELD